MKFAAALFLSILMAGPAMAREPRLHYTWGSKDCADAEVRGRVLSSDFDRAEFHDASALIMERLFRFHVRVTHVIYGHLKIGNMDIFMFPHASDPFDGDTDNLYLKRAKNGEWWIADCETKQAP
jgi:hypothetical protein